MRGRWVAALGVVLVACAVPARACDVCAIYVATEPRESESGLSLGVGEQLSRFQTLQDEGHRIPSGGQELTSSVTQLALGYDFVPEMGVQLTVPLVVRDFRRPEEGVLRSGSEDGLGDVSLVAMLRPLSHLGDQTTFRLSLLGGVKLPTGSAHRIREELSETDEPAGGTPSGVHGHDLALGSGSVDGVVGAALFASWTRLFGAASAQYAIRDQGDFGYQYANELTWSGGPGAYLLLDHAYSLSLQASVTGEHKRNDTLHGVAGDDTAITAVYVGPALAFTWGASLASSVALDLPVVQDNSSIQLVPDFRLRAGLTWHL